jgi:hypothetical protein
MQPSSDTLKNKGSAGLAVLIIALGGGNVAQTRQGVQEVQQLRESVVKLRTEVQGMATDVTLLNWRVSNLEGVQHGQGT